MSRQVLKPISLLPGTKFNFESNAYVITNTLDLESVLAQHIETKKSRRILIRDINPEVLQIDKSLPNNIEMIKDPDWVEANRRFEIIKPILEAGRGSRVQQVTLASKEHGVSPATLYRWIESYSAEERLSSLVRPTRKDKGSTRISNEVEEIIANHIKKSYLTDQRLTPTDVWEKIKSDCLDLDLKPPHINTVRNRISSISDEEKISKRVSKQAANNKFTPIRGSFPGADFPLAVVQIDHTPMDILIVDDESRQSTCRPYLTLAIDVCTKVVHGYYIGLDPVGALSTGLCIAHAILPKEKWLATMNITTPYPVWGRMRVIHTDNAKEFHGNMLGKACQEHKIKLEKRPKGQPQYGGHIERSFRTYMKKVHTLPGTTKSNVQDKGEYDAEGRACMTLSALEQWFAIYIVEYYHQKPHKGNHGVPPILAYERALLGNENQPGIGLPERVGDEYKFKLDFMPFEMRTVQEYGIVFEDIHFYHDSLRRWIHAMDPNDIKRKRKFICRYDPRLLDKLYFYEPDTESYLEVPRRDVTKPPISIWELRAIKKDLKKSGHVDINEELIFSALKKMNAIVEAEERKTKQARRMQSRKKNWSKASTHLAKQPRHSDVDIDLSMTLSVPDIFSEPIQPFDDIEEAQ